MNLKRVLRHVFSACMPTLLLALPNAAFGQADIVLRMLGDSYESAQPYFQRSGCSLPVWHDGRNHRVFLIPKEAERYDFRQGDYIVSINGQSMPAEREDARKFLSALSETGKISVTVYRSGKLLKVPTDCQPAAPLSNELDNLVAALKNADAMGCLSALEGFEYEAMGTLSSGLAEVRLRCHMAANPLTYLETLGAQLYIVARMEIDEYRFFPGRLEAGLDGIQARIEAIRRMEEDELADQLEAQLELALEFAAADEPPPEFL